MKDGDRLAELLDEHDISMMQATPSTWRLLMESRWSTRPNHKRELKALCGGEALPISLAEALLPRVGALWNMYGPTETTVWSSCKRIEVLSGPITVGTPIANTQLYILDEHGSFLPIATPGEICIGGDGLAQGYHENEELTAERFIDHPKLGRLYRTGDLGKLMPDGEVQHLGRLDDQVKLRGYRIELGEIEAVLDAHPSIAMSTARIVGDDQVDARLAAYIVGEALPDDDELRRYLADRLPPYMIPYPIIRLDALPLTPNGKVDRKRLPDLEDAAPSPAPGETFTVPETAAEIAVAKAFSSILKVERIGTEANFFALGGHSILAMRLLAELRRTLSPSLDLKTVFEAENVRALAAIAEQNAGAATQHRQEFEF